MLIAGFDWDDGNWPKCGRHGVSVEEIEEVFRSDPWVFPDPQHSTRETRMLAIGQVVSTGRYVFVAFTLRRFGENRRIRPISARYMHAREIAHYERQRDGEGEGTAGTEQ